MVSKTFVKITNEDIYNEIKELVTHVKELNGSVKTHRKWLTALTSACGVAFLFLLKTFI